MPSHKVDNRKRQLLRTTLGVGVVGTALPNVWTKPIVSAVMLPAHAQTSVFSFSIEKSQSGGPNPAEAAGDVIEYEIVVTNTGNGDLTNVVATDTLPDGSVVILSNPAESLNSDGVLEVNETWTYSTEYEVTQEDVDAGLPLVNSVVVTTEEVPEEQEDDATVPVIGGPAFTVEKIQSGGPNPVTLVGDVIEYEIVVANTGGVSLTNVVATDTLPDGSVEILSDPTESLNADSILEVGEVWTFATMYEATSDDLMAAEDLVNSVSVSVAELPDPQEDDVDTPVVPAVCPDLVIDNINFSPQSSTTTPCGITFELLSTDPTPLTITSITNDVVAPNQVLDDGVTEVTDSSGVTVTWLGQAIGACLTDAQPILDVAFVVEATCEAVPGEVVTLEFNLSDLEGVTVV